MCTKSWEIFFLSTQILCGFLFIFKLFPLSRRLRSRCVRFLRRVANISRSTCLVFHVVSSSNSIIKHKKSSKRCGLSRMKKIFFHSAKIHNSQRHSTLKNPRLPSNFKLIYYRTMFISHSTRREWNSPFKYKMHRRHHQQKQPSTQRRRCSFALDCKYPRREKHPWHLPSFKLRKTLFEYSDWLCRLQRYHSR